MKRSVFLLALTAWAEAEVYRRGNLKWRDVQSSNFSSTPLSIDTEPTILPVTTTLLPPASVADLCTGSAIYLGIQPSTVTVTVTEGFDLTVSPGDDTLTAQETYFTPATACGFTVVPPGSTFSAPTQSPATSPPLPIPTLVPPWTNSSKTIPPSAPFGNLSSSDSFGNTMSRLPQTTPKFGPPSPTPEVVAFTTIAAPFVSTVTVTKKTPVIVPPITTRQSVVFPTLPPGEDSTQTLNQRPTDPPQTRPPGDSGRPDSTRPPIDTNRPPSGTRPPNSPPSNTSRGNGGPVQPNTSVQSNTNTGFAAIIDSIINSPFAAPSTSFGSASATVTLVDGVPVQVGPSTIFVGGQIVALPTASSTQVVVNGQTFTIFPTGIVGPQQTLTIQRQQSIAPGQSLIVVPLASSTITRDGVTVTIGPSQAVISGSTFRIGPSAPVTSVVFGDSRTITLDADGVIFAGPPPTTFTPALTAVNPFITTNIGSLTFAIDQTEAVISGTSYRIGAGATATTVTISGTVVVFGPSGVVVPGSATIKPTSAEITGTSTATSTSTAETIDRQTSGPSATATSENFAPSRRNLQDMAFLAAIMSFLEILV